MITASISLPEAGRILFRSLNEKWPGDGVLAYDCGALTGIVKLLNFSIGSAFADVVRDHVSRPCQTISADELGLAGEVHVLLEHRDGAWHLDDLAGWPVTTDDRDMLEEIGSWLLSHAGWIKEQYPDGLSLAWLAEEMQEDIPGLGLLDLHRGLHASPRWHCPERGVDGVVLWTSLRVLPDGSCGC